MRLLFDENLSFRLVRLLEDLYPQMCLCGGFMKTSAPVFWF